MGGRIAHTKLNISLLLLLLLFFPFFKHILRLNWPIWIFGMRFCRKQLIQHLTLIHNSALPFLIFLFSFFFAGHMKRKHGDSGSHHSNFFFPFFDTCFWTCSGKGTGEFTEYGFSKVKYFNTMTKKTSLPGLKLNSTLLLWVGVGVAQGFWLYWMQQLLRWPLESLKRRRIFGRYFSR